MSEAEIQCEQIHELGHKAMADAHLQEAYRSSTLRLYTHRLEAMAQVPGFERLRSRARSIKQEVMDHLDFYLEQFATNVEARGGKVHWAATGQEACGIIVDLAKRAGVREVVKAKTMVSEEIEMNE